MQDYEIVSAFECLKCGEVRKTEELIKQHLDFAHHSDTMVMD